MKSKVKKEVEKIIKKLGLDCAVEEFRERTSNHHDPDRDTSICSIEGQTDDPKSWYGISHMSLSEDFIREFQDELIWLYISCGSKLSEGFIREFKDKVDWRYISECQEFSKGFISEFGDRFDLERLVEINKLTREELKQIKAEWSVKSRFEIMDL